MSNKMYLKPLGRRQNLLYSENLQFILKRGWNDDFHYRIAQYTDTDRIDIQIHIFWVSNAAKKQPHIDSALENIKRRSYFLRKGTQKLNMEHFPDL